MRTRVVVADDEEHVLASLSTLLEAADYDVVGRAKTGQEAIDMVKSLDPDMVLLDVRMPDMDGLEAAVKISSIKPVPIVLCTAYCDADLIAKAVDAGVYAYVTKPFHLADLIPAMAVAKRRHSDAQSLHHEIDKLGDALEARKWIEKAKGIIMRTRGIDEAQAHQYLQHESQRRSQPIGELARAVVTADEMFTSGK